MGRLSVLAALLLLPSLALTQEIGEGELWVHEEVMEYYRKFDGDSSAAYFAVSTNGYDAGYSRCPSFSNCRPLDGKREAVQACNSGHSDLPGSCYIFANQNGIIWRGEVHVLSDAEFMARLYGPETIEEAVAEYVAAATGPVEGTKQSFNASKQIWQREDFRFPPPDFALTGDECRYAFEHAYLSNAARNFFLADPSGRYCGYSTGYAQAAEATAFTAAKVACATRAPASAPCVVYAVDDTLLPGRSKL
ncbi:MAG TPA: hypothetical protein VJL84_04135 [Kiloniellales bacterium]|nr:hypothetical protein [Kiloniellales bacterium]